jgi:biopolymer transport protein ExbD
VKFHQSQEDDLQINLTPLIDVVFLLLIFFMVSTTFNKESKLQIRLPEASTKQPIDAKQQFIEVQIGESGQFAVKGSNQEEAVVLLNNDTDTLQRSMRKTVGANTDTVVIIRADKNATHENVVRVMDAARRLNLLQVTFATRTETE